MASFGISARVLATLVSGVNDPLAAAGVLCLALVSSPNWWPTSSTSCGETFAAMVFTTYAGFWLSYALLVQFYIPDVTAAGGDVGQLVGM